MNDQRCIGGKAFAPWAGGYSGVRSLTAPYERNNKNLDVSLFSAKHMKYAMYKNDGLNWLSRMINKRKDNTFNLK